MRQDCLLPLYHLCPEINLSQWSFGCYQQQYNLKCIIENVCEVEILRNIKTSIAIKDCKGTGGSANH